MSLQIEKKWIGEEAVDGDKVKILYGQALKGLDVNGNEVEIIKIDASGDAVVPQGVVASESFVSDAVAAEALIRSQEDTNLSGLISAEASARESADTNLLNLISTETSERMSADAGLTTLINNEESSRISEDLTFLKLNGSRGMESNLNMGSGSSGPQLYSITSHTTTAIDEAVAIVGGIQFTPGQNSYEIYKDGVKIYGYNVDGSTFFVNDYQLIASGFGMLFSNSMVEFTAHQIGQYSLWMYTPGSLVPHKIINLSNGTDAGDAVNKSQLDAAVSSILTNVDPAMIDSFTEVVAAFQAADSDLNNAISALGTGSSSALAQEVLDRQAADSLLSARLDVLELDPTTKTYVDSAIYSEESARTAADDALDARLDILEADPTTKTYVDTEVAAKLVEAKAYTDAEVLTEKNRAESAEGLLSGRLDVLEGKIIEEDVMFEVGANGVVAGYIELAHTAEKIFKVCVGRLNTFKGVDYSLSIVNGKTKITWIGELASGGVSPMSNGDKIFVTYIH